MYTLYIGNKNYSSWSVRPWVLMRELGIPFSERRIPLYEPESTVELRRISPTGKVPCLHDGETRVWDSLSIAEYLAERHRGVWPEDRGARAWARSAAAEMHSGFAPLREEMSMNVRLRTRKPASPRVAADIARIVALWAEGRERFGGAGEFLCGAFGAVDAFWCPVAFRFQSYGATVPPAAAAYVRALLELPAMKAWAADAERETQRIASLEPAETQARQ
ncbi:MAG TPA: glutathione S-transferase family protein [Casimicrobiaceae bacterium]|nr:glutathione S-transferase family protein [Casimicrobiaceae bacterium]